MPSSYTSTSRQATYYLFSPCLFLTPSAASLGVPIANKSCQHNDNGWAFSCRFAGHARCTIKDPWDRNLDPRVERTRLRPIAKGAVITQNVIIFTGFQLLTGLDIFLLSALFGVPSLFRYTSERVTWHSRPYPPGSHS